MRNQLYFILYFLVLTRILGQGASAQAGQKTCPLPKKAPALLSQTCLNSTPSIELFEPQYPLYSDGAEKKRWIYLPPGSKINVSNPDQWVFPVGTIFWKEFSLGGNKIETRQMEKVKAGVGERAWRFSVYAWRLDQSEAELIDRSFYDSEETIKKYAVAKVDADYRLINPDQCVTCHRTASDGALGFNYLELSSQSVVFNLDKVNRLGYLSSPLTKYDEIPGTEKERKAIGYMQTNCATCHSPGGDGTNNFRHVSTARQPPQEAVNLSIAMNPALAVAGHPEKSRIFHFLSQGTMPPRRFVPLKHTDPHGVEVIRDWIQSMAVAK